MCYWETTRGAALVKSIIQNWNSYFVAVKSEMQQGPLRTLPIAPESKHFKRKVCITEKKKICGHLQPSTNWGFVAVLLIFSNWLQGPLTSRVLSAMIISSWLWWESLAVKYFLGLLISIENSIKAHSEKARDDSPPCHFQLSSFGPDTSGHLFLCSSNRGSGRIHVTKLLWGLREILPTKRSVQWMIHTEAQ